ncbi:hypothetical protein NDU88_004920 [Pleurodeles waltl]|uniref:Uncharacterized protein n=1 Tax=Pleurodeles waltl TaxID=8319 RepID=A0AAV7LW19_PLEWA|nr:hypothetical protein NDU88_004920 [Pleurodeles waltl]
MLLNTGTCGGLRPGAGEKHQRGQRGDKIQTPKPGMRHPVIQACKIFITKVTNKAQIIFTQSMPQFTSLDPEMFR